MNDQKMTDAQREEWSRHYDDIQWKVISIFTAGVGVLVIYSLSQCHDAPWPELCGLALTFLGVLYVASFRSIRNRLHSNIANTELNAFLTDTRGSSLPRQWNVFVLSFFAAACVFSYQLASVIGGFWVTFMSFVLISALLLYLVWRAGRSDVKGKT